MAGGWVSAKGCGKCCEGCGSAGGSTFVGSPIIDGSAVMGFSPVTVSRISVLSGEVGVSVAGAAPLVFIAD